jgi:hypothetical protein
MLISNVLEKLKTGSKELCFVILMKFHFKFVWYQTFLLSSLLMYTELSFNYKEVHLSRLFNRFSWCFLTLFDPSPNVVFAKGQLLFDFKSDSFQTRSSYRNLALGWESNLHHKFEIFGSFEWICVLIYSASYC